LRVLLTVVSSPTAAAVGEGGVPPPMSSTNDDRAASRAGTPRPIRLSRTRVGDTAVYAFVPASTAVAWWGESGIAVAPTTNVAAPNKCTKRSRPRRRIITSPVRPSLRHYTTVRIVGV